MSIWNDNIAISVVLLLLVKLSIQIPACQDERVIFTAQPGNTETGCEIEDVAVFYCRYNGSSARPQWIINSTVYSSINSELPLYHTYYDYKLFVGSGIRNNNTMYQCQLLSFDEGSLCAYKSTEGRLIARCIQDLDVNYTLHYQFEQGLRLDYLTGISITFVQPDGYENSTFNIKYSDSQSGKLCASDMIPTSICVHGICQHHFTVSSLLPCFNNSAIDLTVTSIHSDLYMESRATTMIDIDNKFVEVSFESLAMTLTFLDKPEEESKFFSIMYAPISHGCDNLPPKLTGNLSNANTVTLQLTSMQSISEPICFRVITRNDKNFIRVDGIHTMDTLDYQSTETSTITSTLILIMITVPLSTVLVGCFLTIFVSTLCHKLGTSTKNKNVEK